jgi:hypothetical protein
LNRQEAAIGPQRDQREDMLKGEFGSLTLLKIQWSIHYFQSPKPSFQGRCHISLHKSSDTLRYRLCVYYAISIYPLTHSVISQPLSRGWPRQGTVSSGTDVTPLNRSDNRCARKYLFNCNLWSRSSIVSSLSAQGYIHRSMGRIMCGNEGAQAMRWSVPESLRPSSRSKSEKKYRRLSL